MKTTNTRTNSSKSHARTSKERFRHRRAHLLKSIESITHDANVYMVIRRSDVYYIYNSEYSHTWLPNKEDDIRPLYRQPTEIDEYISDEANTSYVDVGAESSERWSFTDSSPESFSEFQPFLVPDQSTAAIEMSCSEVAARDVTLNTPFPYRTSVLKTLTLRKPPSLWAKLIQCGRSSFTVAEDRLE